MSSTKTRHSKYFIDDRMVVLEVEGVLFRVYKEILTKDCEVFQTMYHCPPGPEGAEGQTAENPIKLEGVKIEEIEALIDYYCEWMDTESDDSFRAALSEAKGCFHAFLGRESEMPTEPESTSPLAKRLISLLAVSHRYDITRIRDVAIRALRNHLDELGPRNAVERVWLAQQYGVDGWLKPALIELCMDSKPLTTKDLERLGPDDFVKLVVAREKYCRFETRERCDTRIREVEPNYHWNEAGRIVMEIFCIESSAS